MCSSSNPELNCLCPQWWHIHPHSTTVILEYSRLKIALLFSSLEGKRVVNYNFVLITLITVKMCSSWWHWQEHKPLLCFSDALTPLPAKKQLLSSISTNNGKQSFHTPMALTLNQHWAGMQKWCDVCVWSLQWKTWWLPLALVERLFRLMCL